MTVLTKPISEMKKKYSQAVPLVMSDQPVAGAEVVVVSGITKNGRGQRERDVENLVTAAMRNQSRVNSATTVCLFLVGLLVMSIGIVGGIYLYQQCARKPMQRLRGFLNVPYNTSDSRHLFYHLEPNAAQQISERTTDMKKGGYFYERFEADDTHEKIDVPEFQGGRHGMFIHDFLSNKTGIIDVEGSRCFVIPLDSDAVLVLPDFVLKIAQQAQRARPRYDIKVIVKSMRVIFPSVQGDPSIGAHILRECAKMKIYTLIRADLNPVFKRSAEEPVVFGSFAGNMMKYEIVNYHEMEEAEKARDEVKDV